MKFITGQPPPSAPGVAVQSTSTQGRTRSAPRPVQPRTRRQQRVRNGFSNGAKSYPLLNYSGRQAWLDYNLSVPPTASTVKAVVPDWPDTPYVPGYPPDEPSPPWALAVNEYVEDEDTLYVQYYSPEGVTGTVTVVFAGWFLLRADFPITPLVISSGPAGVGWGEVGLVGTGPPGDGPYARVAAFTTTDFQSGYELSGYREQHDLPLYWGGVRYPVPPV